ncbi:hypothetical protein SDC9_52492 [bioreactor metagenome]|uniref:Uncharacterized protein n=1 Tax=bioreactor metagenome TaxID=1076179 RepID=A0A644WQL2_9ZZZZ
MKEVISFPVCPQTDPRLQDAQLAGSGHHAAPAVGELNLRPRGVHAEGVDEGPHHQGIQVVPRARDDLRNSLVPGQTFLVGPLRRDGVVGIGHRGDPGGHGDGPSLETVRVAGTVHLFVVMAHDLQDQGIVDPRPFQQRLPHFRMPFDEGEFPFRQPSRLVQNGIRNKLLPYVVKQTAHCRAGNHFVLFGKKPVGEKSAEQPDAEGMGEEEIVPRTFADKAEQYFGVGGHRLGKKPADAQQGKNMDVAGRTEEDILAVARHELEGGLEKVPLVPGGRALPGAEYIQDLIQRLFGPLLDGNTIHSLPGEGSGQVSAALRFDMRKIGALGKEKSAFRRHHILCYPSAECGEIPDRKSEYEGIEHEGPRPMNFRAS